MSDLISRQDAIDAMYRLEAEDIETYGCSIPEGFDSKPAIEALRALPSAEPERKKGKWLGGNGTDTFIHCSVCYEEAYWDSDYGQQTFDFCPYCGADMRGE